MGSSQSNNKKDGSLNVGNTGRGGHQSNTRGNFDSVLTVRGRDTHHNISISSSTKEPNFRGIGGHDPNTRGMGDHFKNTIGVGDHHTHTGRMGDHHTNTRGMGDHRTNTGRMGDHHTNTRGLGDHCANTGALGDHLTNNRGMNDHSITRGRDDHHHGGASNAPLIFYSKNFKDKDMAKKSVPTVPSNKPNFHGQSKKSDFSGPPKQPSGGVAKYDPPPPYEMAISNINDRVNTTDNPMMQGKKKLKPAEIVMVLIEFKDFFSKDTKVAKLTNSTPDDVMDVVKNNPNIFSSMKDKFSNDTLIELSPKISVCSFYLDKNGCSMKNCDRLHICSKYILNNCPNGTNCQYCHDWKSRHNYLTLSKLNLNSLSDALLSRLFRKARQVSNICEEYNIDKCSSVNCDNLHICLDQVLSLGACNQDSCSLNHNILDPKCQELLEKMGISTNETPRDLMNIIINRSQIPKASKETKKGNKDKEDDKNHNILESKCRDLLEKTGTSTNEAPRDLMKIIISTSQIPKAGKDIKQGNKDKADDKKVDAKFTTLSNHLFGDVDVPQICLFGLNNKCKNLKTGCKFLHAIQPFHWQFKAGKKWYNMMEFQVKVLEDHYKNPNSSGCEVPPLRNYQVPEKMRGLIGLLGSNKAIYADFNKMTITGEAFTEVRHIRHLSTASSVILNDTRCTIYHWYYQTEGKGWQSYDHSHVIEKAFNQTPDTNLSFNSHIGNFEINFQNMTQTNKSTNEQRPLRRRPKGMVKEDTKLPVPPTSTSILPTQWDKMNESDVFSLVQLNSTCDEFEEVYKCIRPTCPLINILSISRIQNPHLWKQFKARKDYMKAHRTYPLNITNLFHGVDEARYKDICCNNLDYRIHYPNADRKYGNGTYFFNSVAKAQEFCYPDRGFKHLLVVKVILGAITVGWEGLTNPPQIPGSNCTFDTTVDSPPMPEVFVKFNKQEYYPAYLVSFK